ncbi:MAG: outer membrane beta-barrel protein [Gammaproteobacteria bacterium]|nr:outer membrane beta-barrel protein [Gammaproteobacteria bacterium]
MKLFSIRNVFLATVILSATSNIVYADHFNQDDLQSMQSAPNLHQRFYMSLNVLPVFAGGFYTGYLFTPSFGLEAGIDDIWVPDFLGIDDAMIVHLDAKGILPLGSRFELFGKFGLGYLQGNEEIGAIPPYLPSYTVTSSCFGLAFGAGLGFSFTPRWVATIEANGIVYPHNSVLEGNVIAIPTIGITHYFSG